MLIKRPSKATADQNKGQQMMYQYLKFLRYSAQALRLAVEGLQVAMWQDALPWAAAQRVFNNDGVGISWHAH